MRDQRLGCINRLYNNGYINGWNLRRLERLQYIRRQAIGQCRQTDAGERQKEKQWLTKKKKWGA